MGIGSEKADASTVHKFCGELQGTRIQCDVDGQDVACWMGNLQLEFFFFAACARRARPRSIITVGPPAGSKPPTGGRGGRVWRRVS